MTHNLVHFCNLGKATKRPVCVCVCAILQLNATVKTSTAFTAFLITRYKAYKCNCEPLPLFAAIIVCQALWVPHFALLFWSTHNVEFFFFYSPKTGLEILICGAVQPHNLVIWRRLKKDTRDRYKWGERVIEKSTVINRCVIGGCQLNVLVSCW